MNAQPEFTISRMFDAPRALVFKAWTTPELMAKWWGPKGAAVGKSKMDLRVGGIYHYSMMFNGFEMWGKFTYREIAAPSTLVFVNSFSDAEGNITRHPINANWPRELLSTITFEEENGKTKVTVKWMPINASEIEIKTFADGLPSMNQGWGGTLDQLETYLAEQKAA